VVNKEKIAVGPHRPFRTLRLLFSLILIFVLLSACTMAFATVTATPSEALPSPSVTTVPTVTLIPTVPPLPSPTSIPSDPPATIAMDFVALLCNADWMNGVRHLTPCPSGSADQSGGYAARQDPVPEGLPAGTPILLMIPNANALFLRYPSFTVAANDRLRATLLCKTASPCEVEFALEYYDAKGKYHEFLKWDYKTDDPPIEVDADLSALTGQKVDFVLTLRLFHAIEDSQHDNGLWVAPHIFRPSL